MSVQSKKVLEFWRNLEIFHLPDIDKDALPLSEFDGMPWEYPEPLRNEKKSKRYIFYIGRVAKNKVISWLELICGNKANADWMEPVTGDTCLAAMMMDENGQPYWNSYVHSSFMHGISCLDKGLPLSSLNSMLASVQSAFEKRYNIEQIKSNSGADGSLVRKGDTVTDELLEKEMEILQEALGADFQFEQEIYWVEKEVMPDSEVESPILNSFYLDDLNQLMNTNQLGSALKEYLTHLPEEDQRRDMIADTHGMLQWLDPDLLSPGRWPSRITNSLYTAQQAAVNATLNALKSDNGIRGINGPPGTGKTTLLLDIIADIIVSRALILLETNVKEIFQSKSVLVANETYKYYYHPFATSALFEGHGIVVSSNNNRAVENISMELPSLEKIDREKFEDAFSYFSACAGKLVKNKSCWGTISATLGNSKNRNTFRWNFWESDGAFPGFKDYLYNVYRDEDNDQTAAYVQLFNETKEELTDLLKEFYTFVKKAAAFHKFTFSDKLQKMNKKTNDSSGEKLTQHYFISPENLINKAFLKADYDQLHLRTPYSSPELNHLRSLIFIKSLKLHEYAIMANAKQFKNTLTLFMQVLTGKMKVEDKVAPILWNTFFFCVPVVSTTLASAGRLFRQLSSEDIGWLLLDEAGQATPQSAAGIIWRSKRCIIVGDPLQIKPVVTHPDPLVKLLREDMGLNDKVWSPLVSSVQSLADRISTLGTYLGEGEETQWSGFPLRAHRRCDNPMFELANSIAYENQMVKATQDQPYKCVLGNSRWFNVNGVIVEEKHVIQEEIRLLKKLVEDLIRSGFSKEIYIISPFTSVKFHCEDVFEKHKNVKCGTVHTFQGQEAEIVFLILGSDPSKPGARNWVTESPNMINVALTRAKHRFFLIGNLKLWGQLPIMNQLKKKLPIEHVKSEDLY